MNNGDLVRFVVRTYELGPELESKVVRIAERRINDLYISTFAEIYDYVSRLIEKFMMPYDDRRHLCLSNSYQNVEPDNNFDDIPFSESISLEDFVREFGNEVGRVRLGTITQLWQGASNGALTPLPFSPARIRRVLPFACAKLDEILDNSSLVFPPRPVESFQFRPFSIKFGRRRYYGNPLDFFKAHQDVYQGMSRGRLQKFDGGLYKSLRKAGQLHLAIPMADIRARARKVDEILAAYRTYNGNSARAAANLHYSDRTIANYWKDAGLEPRGRVSSERHKTAMKSAYFVFKGNAAKAAKYLSCHITNVLYHWRKMELQPRRKTVIANESVVYNIENATENRAYAKVVSG